MVRGDGARRGRHDFGIALLAADDRTPPTGAGSERDTAGTPAYMAPEQFDNEPIDARADQFSFAVALFEALEGRRPFPGTTVASIRAAMRAGPAMPRSLIPLRTTSALRRALSERPDDRFPSMAHLLRRVTPSRVRPLYFVALATALGVGVVGATVLIGEPSGPAPCRGLGVGVTEIWGPSRAVALTAAFLRTGDPDAGDTARSVRAGLDRYVSSWTANLVDTCEAAQVRREQTPAQQELRTACLDERLGELRGVTDVLLEPDREVITNAYAVLASLTPPDACRDLATLAQKLPVATSPEQVARVRALRVQLARVNAQIAAGQFGPAEAQLASLRPLVAAAAYRPLEAEAALAAGEVANREGRFDQAERELRAAVLAAEAGRANRTAASAWLQLANLRARGRGDLHGANDALPHAAAAVERLGPDIDAEADLAYARGATLRLAGRYARGACCLRGRAAPGSAVPCRPRRSTSAHSARPRRCDRCYRRAR
nr:protein kinase [Deltaproteobacteria bacterium]